MLTRKTVYGSLLAALCICAAGVAFVYKFDANDNERSSVIKVPAPRYQSEMAKAQADFKVALSKPPEPMPKDDPLAKALAKEFPAPEFKVPDLPPIASSKDAPNQDSKPDVQHPLPLSPEPVAANDTVVKEAKTGSLIVAVEVCGDAGATGRVAESARDPGNSEITAASPLLPSPNPESRESKAVRPASFAVPDLTAPAITTAPAPMMNGHDRRPDPQILDLPVTPSACGATPPLGGQVNPLPASAPPPINPPSTIASQPPSGIVLPPPNNPIEGGHTDDSCLPLTGMHNAKLINGKIQLPADVGHQLGHALVLYVTPECDNTCLSLTTAQRLAAMAPIGNAAARLHFARSERLSVDFNGCVNLPDALCRAVGLGNDVVIAGTGYRFEIWDKARWQEFVANNSAAANGKPSAMPILARDN